ncbi:hypothetical protein D3C80_1375570 [compost metagenome]
MADVTWPEDETFVTLVMAPLAASKEVVRELPLNSTAVSCVLRPEPSKDVRKTRVPTELVLSTTEPDTAPFAPSVSFFSMTEPSSLTMDVFRSSTSPSLSISLFKIVVWPSALVKSVPLTKIEPAVPFSRI